EATLLGEQVEGAGPIRLGAPGGERVGEAAPGRAAHQPRAQQGGDEESAHDEQRETVTHWRPPRWREGTGWGRTARGGRGGGRSRPGGCRTRRSGSAASARGRRAATRGGCGTGAGSPSCSAWCRSG